MPYALVDVELSEALPAVQLADDEVGVAIVSRRDGHVVGFAMHEAVPGSVLQPADLEALLDPDPVQPAVLDPAPGPRPTITVAVCTRDRTDQLEQCLAALTRLHPHPDEVLVVDNAPSDGRTRELVTRLGLRYEVEPCPGLDFARNRALRRARSSVVAFIDDDVVPDRHWFASVLGAWRQHPDAGAVTGQILPLELETDAQVAFERRGGFRGGNQQVRYAGQHLEGNPIYPYGPGMFGAGANMSFSRQMALRLGAFDEALDTGPPLPGGGDIDLMHRVVRAGFPLVYEPRAVVFHRHRRDREALLRQYDSWGRSLMAFAAKTYVRDPDGRPKLRRLIGWFFAAQTREVIRAVMASNVAAREAALAELRGGVAGLLGTYPRSKRTSRRRRLAHGNPTVAILPWGDLLEDYTGPLSMSLDDYSERLSGGWLFGFTEALARTAVETVIVCWSRSVARPTRRVHVPTGAWLWILPPSRAYEAARSRLADPYAWNLRAAVGGTGRRPGALRVVARVVAPYLTATPVALARVLREEACASVLCQEYEEGRFDLCVALGRLLRLPVFATFQGGDHTRTRLERCVRPRTVRAAAGLIVAAEREVDRLCERYRIPRQAIARIPNPLDPSTVRRIPRQQARLQLGIRPETRVAIWHGRVDINPKGIDTLIEAWCQVRRSCSGPPILLLLGTGSGASWLQRRISDLALDDVHWRNEYVLDRDVVGTYLSAADVFVLPSRQEGFPVAPVEAMAAGLPVVATDAPGVRAVVGNGEAAGGLVVPHEDAQGLAAALRLVLDDDQLRAALATRAEQRVRDHFSLEAVGAQLRAFLTGPSSDT
ncbi:MAG: glycosyltransferase [Actinomycetota bacterium]|nr:glycosyltransferase [Actinomycetota bacterium]